MIHPLPFTVADLWAYARQVGAPDVDRGAECLARAIACSPGWSRIPGCSVLLRRSPPALAVVGQLDPGHITELGTQADAARRRLHSFRYVSYGEAEKACVTLAARLRRILRKPEWEGCRFRAIPNGGHLVLGMLATVLSLPHRQLDPSSSPQTPVVLVDDCILTGTRLRQQLEHSQEERVIVAHLYSHPSLRRAALETEPRLAACVAAGDLRSGPRDSVDSGIWPTPPGDTAYWRGRSEHVGFAWNEPDRSVAGGGLPEPLEGWKLLPPELCLKNRRLPTIPVVQQRTGIGAMHPSSTALFLEDQSTVTLASTDGGELVQLRGAAADAWKALLDTGDTALAEAHLKRSHRVSASELHRDLESMWADLRKRGFLEENLTR